MVLAIALDAINVFVEGTIRCSAVADDYIKEIKWIIGAINESENKGSLKVG